jgi:hypothetical protein
MTMTIVFSAGRSTNYELGVPHGSGSRSALPFFGHYLWISSIPPFRFSFFWIFLS